MTYVDSVTKICPCLEQDSNLGPLSECLFEFDTRFKPLRHHGWIKPSFWVQKFWDEKDIQKYSMEGDYQCWRKIKRKAIRSLEQQTWILFLGTLSIPIWKRYPCLNLIERKRMDITCSIIYNSWVVVTIIGVWLWTYL